MQKFMHIIGDWIEPNSIVLELGCGNGQMLSKLNKSHNIVAYGIDDKLDNVVQCIKKSVNVLSVDIDTGISTFENNTFDYVLINMMSQSIYNPVKILCNVKRIASNIIIAFSNHSHITNHACFSINEREKLSKDNYKQNCEIQQRHLAKQWSISEFTDLCSIIDVKISKKHILNDQCCSNAAIKCFPNLFGKIGLFCLET
jgi:methionine biosynthesis protein MetW